MTRMLAGTTPPDGNGDAMILEAQRSYGPGLRGILVLIEEDGQCRVVTMTMLPPEVLIGAVAAYVHGLAVELGMPE